jgi:hypothetical protein
MFPPVRNPNNTREHRFVWDEASIDEPGNGIKVQLPRPKFDLTTDRGRRLAARSKRLRSLPVVRLLLALKWKVDARRNRVYVIGQTWSNNPEVRQRKPQPEVFPLILGRDSITYTLQVRGWLPDGTPTFVERVVQLRVQRHKPRNVLKLKPLFSR